MLAETQEKSKRNIISAQGKTLHFEDRKESKARERHSSGNKHLVSTYPWPGNVLGARNIAMYHMEVLGYTAWG